MFTDSSLKFAGMDTCTFWLRRPDGATLERKAGGSVTRGHPGHVPGTLPVKDGLIGQAFHQRLVLI